MKNVLLTVLAAASAFISCTNTDMAIDRKNLDPGVEPGSDFYRYSNGGWMDANPLPAEFSRYGSFDKLAEDNQKMVKSLVEELAKLQAASDDIHAKAGLFYKTGMDSAEVEGLGITPLKADFEMVEGISDHNSLMELIISQHKKGNMLLFTIAGTPDRKNSSMMIANIFQGGLGLTDVDYYREETEKAKEIRERYKSYIREMMVLTGMDDANASQSAETIMMLETRLANASLTRLERRDQHRTYNKMSIEELGKLAPGFMWDEYFRALDLQITSLNVGMPGFFKELNKMLKEVETDQWKVYLKWHILNPSSPFLSSEFVDANFEFYGKFLSGKQVNQPRWKRVLQTSEMALGEAIGQLFVEKYFPAESKERMLVLVGNLKLALAERIRNLDWMSDSTRMEALSKLESMRVKIGYPDKWRDYAALEVKDDSYYANVRRAAQFNQEYRLSKIGKPVDPDEWGMTPQTVNAYYSPSRNEIVFPAGILQPPFFYPDADDAVNYGAIGVVIGHEMTHGFDDQGRQYDKNGNLHDWWTKEDAEKFSERSQVLVDQYNAFNVLDTVKANGQLTIGENIADLGGLNIAFSALKQTWKDGKKGGKINGFTPEQRFILAYSHIWAQNISEAEILRRTKEDVHSLGRFRVNGPLPNFEPFYAAFDIREGDAMYLEPVKRASIW